MDRNRTRSAGQHAPHETAIALADAFARRRHIRRSTSRHCWRCAGRLDDMAGFIHGYMEFRYARCGNPGDLVADSRRGLVLQKHPQGQHRNAQCHGRADAVAGGEMAPGDPAWLCQLCCSGCAWDDRLWNTRTFRQATCNVARRANGDTGRAGARACALAPQRASPYCEISLSEALATRVSNPRETEVACCRRILHTISKIPAAPMPVPMHIVTMPYFCCLRRMPCTRVATRMEPVAPSGWPSAIAPPSGLTLSGSRPRSLMTARDCAAKASLSSIQSSRSCLMPVALSAFGMASFGPMPMISGGTPATENPTKRASGVKP